MLSISKIAPAASVLFLLSGAFGLPTEGWQEPGLGGATPPPSVPDQYRFLYETGRTRTEAWAMAQRTFPYESISIARRGCFGTCPRYTATMRVDGSATYAGEGFAERMGTFAGKSYFGDFAQLAMFIERSGFMKLSDTYAAPWTDDETVVLTVTMRDGATKTVTNYGRFGPPDLWVLERAIDGVLDQIKWMPSTLGQAR